MIPGKILNVLAWFGVIFLCAFPDGRFTPRWTAWLAALVIAYVLIAEPLWFVAELVFALGVAHSVIKNNRMNHIALRSRRSPHPALPIMQNGDGEGRSLPHG